MHVKEQIVAAFLGLFCHNLFSISSLNLLFWLPHTKGVEDIVKSHTHGTRIEWTLWARILGSHVAMMESFRAASSLHFDVFDLVFALDEANNKFPTLSLIHVAPRSRDIN